MGAHDVYYEWGVEIFKGGESLHHGGWTPWFQPVQICNYATFKHWFRDDKINIWCKNKCFSVHPLKHEKNVGKLYW